MTIKRGKKSVLKKGGKKRASAAGKKGKLQIPKKIRFSKTLAKEEKRLKEQFEREVRKKKKMLN